MENKIKIYMIIMFVMMATTVSVGAVTLINSKDVIYDNTVSGLESTTVQEAVDELYEKAKTCDKPVCKRATTLHTEECKETDEIRYCSGAGYTASGGKGTTTITYGNLGVEGVLTSGDAFDCDVTGNGNWQRFYYVTSNGNNAVLIYYNNTTNGVEDNTSSSLVAYYSIANENYHGPGAAYQNLPSTSQWSNSKIILPGRRQITNELGGTTTNNGSNSIQLFTYTNKAARLLTYQEVVEACGTVATDNTGYLDNCNYLLENMKYSDTNIGTYGYWLETPRFKDNVVWRIYSSFRYVGINDSNYNNNVGSRPVIEVLKSDMSY